MSAEAIGEALAACYREIDATAMRDAPICNAALHVTAIGFREYQSYAVGVILTPWFLNLVVTEIGPGAAPALPLGAFRLRFPAGSIEFTVTELAGFGRLASCSLFSPLFDFPDQETARATAQAALDAVFDPSLHAAQAEDRPAFDRRAFFGGRRLQQGAPP
jgi:[NiFe] hydrogenase assembly HybE family chaperone